MRSSLFTTFALSTLLTLTTSTLINLRIEGLATTIFEGTIRTTGHNVTTPSGGTHKCDGTNFGANPSPGATITSALDDASRRSRGGNRFTWDATWFDSFEDFFITRVGQDTQTDTAFWGLLVDWQFTDVGGCQQRVTAQDEDVLIAYDAFGKQYFLKMELVTTGRIERDEEVQVRVTDGVTGVVVPGAVVEGSDGVEAVVDAEGLATVSWGTRGKKALKASHPDAVRSNKVVVKVKG